MTSDVAQALVVAVVGRDGGLGSALSNALAGLGAHTHLFTDRNAGDAVCAELDAWADSEGKLDALVYASAGNAPLTASPIQDMAISQWEAAFDTPLEHMVTWFQAAFPHLDAAQGRIVVVQPTVGLSGAPDFSALAGLAEAQRALVKVAARQWRMKGLAVNIVAIRPDVFAPELADPRLGDMWSRVAQMGAGEGFSDPPLPLDVTDDLAPLVAFLSSHSTHRMTGQTVVLDGATWMVP